MISGWLAFWDKPHCIYVNARHREVHYRLLARQIAALAPSAQARVLDYGSGEALHADMIAASAAEVLLCDGAPQVRGGIVARFAGNAKIRVLAPEDVAQLPSHTLDLIVLHSVVQYLTREEADALFVLFYRLLKPDGRLIVSDVISRSGGAFADVAALLRFAAANGFVVAALAGLARTMFSDYRKLRARLGIARYDEAEMIAKLAGAGFAASSAPLIIGHDGARLAFVAQPR